MDDLIKLTDQQIDDELAELQSGWTHAGEAITKTFTFDDFADAADFIAALGDLSNDMEGHAPDEVVLKGRTVLLRLSTHSVQGVSEADLDMARACDEIVEGALAWSVADRFEAQSDEE